MLLILSQKENAKQDILILVIMNVYMISSITLFSLTFCHCGPVFLSLLKCVSSDGKCRGGAVIWVLLSISLEGTAPSQHLPPRADLPTHLLALCVLGTLIWTPVKYKSSRIFILKIHILPVKWKSCIFHVALRGLYETGSFSGLEILLCESTLCCKGELFIQPVIAVAWHICFKDFGCT